MELNRNIFLNALVILFLVQMYSCTSPPSDEKIIQDYYEGVGGYENLKSIESIHTVIAHREEGLDFTIQLEIYGRRPDLRRVNWSVEEYNMSGAEGFTGTEPWEVNPENGRAEVLTGAKGDAARRGAEFDESFVDAELKGHSVEYIGSLEKFRQEVHQLRVILKDGWINDYFFDKESKLVVGLQKTMPVHGEGEPIKSITRYSDYREINGVLFPHKFDEYDTETDEWMSGNEVLLFETNVAFADNLVQPPNDL